MLSSMFKLICGAVSVALLNLPFATAQSGPPQYQIYVSNVPLSCSSHYGEPVPIYVDDSVYQNIGIAARNPMNGAPYIIISPSFLNQVTYQAAVFWFYHECAHHALAIGVGSQSQGAEVNADCYAIRAMRNHGLVRNQYDFDAIISSIVGMPGTQQHLPGPYRAQHLWNCLNT